MQSNQQCAFKFQFDNTKNKMMLKQNEGDAKKKNVVLNIHLV